MRPEAQKLSEELQQKVLRIIGVIEAFDQVVESCFAVDLRGDYEEKIRVFTELYMCLNKDYKISVTSKVHLVMSHVVNQIHRRHPGYGIGAMTEQAFESAHHEFKLEWQKVKVAPDHPEYGQRLLDTIVR